MRAIFPKIVRTKFWPPLKKIKKHSDLKDYLWTLKIVTTESKEPKLSSKKDEKLGL